MSRDLNPTCATTQRFLQDLKLNGKSPRTQQAYCRAVRKFSEFLGHSPEDASEDQLRHYLLYLVDCKQWKGSTINVAQQALKLFFRITCPRDWNVLKLARVQVEQKLPVVISIGEVHTLRHCYATHLLEAGVSLKLIQKYLGHKHLTSTMIYLHITTVGEEAAIAKINAIMKRNP